MLENTLKSRSPLTDLRRTGGAGRFAASEQEGLTCVSVIARPGRETELSHRARERFGVELPIGPRRMSSTDGTAFIGIGPGSWLAIARLGSGTSFASLQQALEGAAAVTDQSSAYVWLRMTGPEVRAVLGRIVSVDLHERAFRIDDVACTAAHHIPLVLWRLEDPPGQASRFETLIPRSYAGSFWDALLECAAEFDPMAADRTP